jgi:hypothetical protein
MFEHDYEKYAATKTPSKAPSQTYQSETSKAGLWVSACKSVVSEQIHLCFDTLNLLHISYVRFYFCRRYPKLSICNPTLPPTPAPTKLPMHVLWDSDPAWYHTLKMCAGGTPHCFFLRYSLSIAFITIF